jgi:serine/threonine protein kinase
MMIQQLSELIVWFRIIGTAIDIWALGVTLYFFIFGRPPFQADIEVQLYDNIKNNEVQFPHKIDADLQDLIERLLEKDPEKRITIPEIKKHPWLKNK